MIAKKIQFRSDTPVTAINSWGDDGLIASAAWAEKPYSQVCNSDEEAKYHERHTDECYTRLITAMMKGRHGTPFEHVGLSVYVEAPVVVWWEWTRHRHMAMGLDDFSFNLESGRYKMLEGVFWIPREDRPCKEPEGFKPMRPVLEKTNDSYYYAAGNLGEIAIKTWEAYQHMLSHGVAREVARYALPFSIYYAGYVTANLRSWLNFLSLRVSSPDAAAPTFPQQEIQDVAKQCEKMIEERFPITYNAFVSNGRVAP